MDTTPVNAELRFNSEALASSSTGVTVRHGLPVVAQAVGALAQSFGLPVAITLTSLAEADLIAPEGRFAVLMERADRRQIAEARQRGAVGALPLDMPVDELRAAIGCLLIGRSWWPVARNEGASANAFEQKLDSLSGQQWKVLDLMSKGRLNKQIAYDLGISEGTVKSHVSAILRKLGVERRTQAIANYIALNEPPRGGSAALARVVHAAAR
jgi:DNA-binding NarL/FixJ family response regulator